MDESLEELKTFSLDDIQTKGFSDVFNHDSYSQTAGGESLGYADPRILKAAYMHEEWIYILVDKTAMYLAQIPWQVHKQTIVDGDIATEPALNHPLQRSLDYPNPLQSAYHFKYSIVTDLSVTGNAFVFDSKSNGWLVQFPTEICQPRIDGDGTLQSYDVVGYDPLSFPVGQRNQLRPDKVVHIKRPNPSSVYWGLSPLIAGSQSVAFSKYANQYLINYFEKGAQPGVVLQFTDESNVEQAKRLLQSLQANNMGRRNQRNGMILPKGVELKQLSSDLADQQLLEYLNHNREKLINLFGVPKQELSIAESHSLGSDEYKIAVANFWRGPLTSLAMMIESAMNLHFGPRLGKGYVIKLNMSGVPALQDDLKTKADTANAMRASLTLNEVRAMVWKLPPVPGGDVVELASPAAAANPMMGGFGGFGASSTHSPTPEPAKLGPATEPAKLGGESEPTKLGGDTPVIAANAPEIKPLGYQQQNIEALYNYKKSDDGKWLEDYQSRNEDHAQGHMIPVARLFLKTLDRQVYNAVRIVKAHLKKHKAEDVPAKDDLIDALKGSFEETKKQWKKDYVETLLPQVYIGYDNVLKIPFNQPYQDEISAIRDRNAKGLRSVLEARGIETFANVNETTTNAIMQAVEDGISNSKTLEEIAQTISDIADVSAGRASTIARTEVLTASSIGQAAADQDAATVIPNMVKVWVNANDSLVRGNPNGKYPNSEFDHWNLQSEVVGIDEKFSNGLDYPRDTKGAPGDTINCRCSWLSVSEDDLERLGIKRRED